MGNMARVGDPASCQQDFHGSPFAPIIFPVVGTFTSGSPNSFCNNLSAVRLGDPGSHVACCGPNSFKASLGRSKTFINDKPAIGDGDSTTHCDNPLSVGKVMVGLTSPNTPVEFT